MFLYRGPFLTTLFSPPRASFTRHIGTVRFWLGQWLLTQTVITMTEWAYVVSQRVGIATGCFVFAQGGFAAPSSAGTGGFRFGLLQVSGRGAGVLIWNEVERVFAVETRIFKEAQPTLVRMTCLCTSFVTCTKNRYLNIHKPLIHFCFLKYLYYRYIDQVERTVCYLHQK